MNNTWVRTPLVRVAAAAVSWFGFALAFGLLYQVALAVIALGGYCASGGPYEIAVECPENVVAFAPLSIFGGLIAVGIGVFFSNGFGAQLTAWAWAILFIGLAVPFAIGGGISNWFVCVLFVLMGAVPLVLELRANAARAFIGSRTARGDAFAFANGERRSLMSMGAPVEGTVTPNAGHALAGFLVPAVSAALGVLLALSWFSAS
ncbi:hypothetical protein [Schumannella luteola]